MKKNALNAEFAKEFAQCRSLKCTSRREEK
jgi:hypothetical protein